MTAIQVRKTAEEPGATSVYQRRARLPGFRKGKAPAALVKRQFAEDIRQQTLEELIRESWKAALAQEALKPVAADKPKPKDLVQVTIATREGDAVKDPQPYQLVLGEGRAIPEVEERIMGMLPGETVDATVRFPSDFPEEAKRGQPRDIRITLHEVKRQQLPELDDAFARE